MKTKDVCAINLAILAGVLMALFLGAGFHQVNMNRKYWGMLNAGCINTNALANLEIETGQVDLAKDNMIRVPQWIANINSTLRLGVLAVVSGIIVNLILMWRTTKKVTAAGQRAALLPRESQTGHSEGVPRRSLLR